MAYQGRQPGVGVRNRFIYSATGGQTSFSGADSNGLTLAYADATYVDVFLNGVLLVPVSDYAATTKTSVVLGSGAAASDIVEIVAYDISSIANAVPTSGGTFTGAVTVQGNFSADGGTIKLDGNYPVGTGNVALGNDALDSGSLSGGYNTAIGQEALSSNTSGSVNTAIGNGALYLNTTGANNISVGSNSLADNTTGGSNVAVGRDALGNNTTASENTAVGYQSLYGNTTGGANTSMGRLSMGSATVTGNNNVSIGESTLRFITSGSNNTALGSKALQQNTTASYNTAVGYQASLNATTGAANTFVGGLSAGLGVVTGSHNVGLGAETLYRLTSGGSNVSIGYQALQFNTTGSSNVAIGREALENNTASNNNAVGYQSLYSNTTGAVQTAMGHAALYSNTTGTENTAFGGAALLDNTTGNYNVAVGRNALVNNTTASNNTAVGYQAGFSATTSGYNTFIGQTAGYSTTGVGNTFVGCTNASVGAGYFVTTGTKNTIIGGFHGNQGGLDIRTSNNNIVLSDGDGNPRVHVDSNGKTFVGPENTNNATFHVHSLSNYWTAILYNLSNSDVTNVLCRHHWATGSNTATQISFRQSNGNEVGSIKSSGSSTSYNTSSDHRLKENVDYTWDATTRLKQLKPARFNFIADADTTVDGFLAHEAQAVVPEAVHGTHNEVEVWKEDDELPDGVSVGDNKLDDDGNTIPVMQGIDQSKLVPLLVKTIQELEARITALEGA